MASTKTISGPILSIFTAASGDIDGQIIDIETPISGTIIIDDFQQEITIDQIKPIDGAIVIQARIAGSQIQIIQDQINIISSGTIDPIIRINGKDISIIDMQIEGNHDERGGESIADRARGSRGRKIPAGVAGG